MKSFLQCFSLRLHSFSLIYSFSYFQYMQEIAYSSKKDYLLSWLNDVKKLFAEKSLPVDRMYRRERARKMARNKYQTLGYAMPLPKLRKRMKYDFLYNRSDY